MLFAVAMACTSAPSSTRSDKESLEDCMCTICLCILIHPVTLPCGHELCMPCFKQTVEEANLTCPLCRVRISTWTRRASKSKTLVNQKRWEQIQILFPQRVQRRLEGLEEETDEEIEEKEEIDVSYRRMVQLSKPGEIRQEYEEELKRLADQQAKERKLEEEASAALIQRLNSLEDEHLLEARRQQEEIARRDAEYAQELGRIINTVEPETPQEVLLQVSMDIDPNGPRVQSVSSSSSCTSRDSVEKAKQTRPKSRGKTLETFFRRLPADARIPVRCSSEPKSGLEECTPGKNSSSTKNSLCFRPVSAPVGNKENVPQHSTNVLFRLDGGSESDEDIVEVETLRRRHSVSSEDSDIVEIRGKNHLPRKTGESVISVNSDDSVVVCDRSVVNTDVDVPSFKPIQSSPQSPSKTAVTLKPCVVRMTPRALFSSSPKSSSPPVPSDLTDCTEQSGTDMGSLKSKLWGEGKCTGLKSVDVNGVVGREGSFVRRASSCSPPTLKVLPRRRHAACDKFVTSPYSRSTLKDVRRENCPSPVEDVQSDSELSCPSRRYPDGRTKPSQKELSRIFKSSKEVRDVLSVEETVVGKSDFAGCDLLVGKRTEAEGQSHGYEHDEQSPSSCHLPSTAQSKSDAVGASLGNPVSDPSAVHRAVGIFNPATVPTWSGALYVDTVKGKGKRLMKSVNSSISNRNVPKSSEKTPNKDVSDDKVRVCSDVGASNCEEDRFVPSVVEQKTPQKVRSSSRVASGRKAVPVKCDRITRIKPLLASDDDDSSSCQGKELSSLERQAPELTRVCESNANNTCTELGDEESDHDVTVCVETSKQLAESAVTGGTEIDSDTEDRTVRRVRRPVPQRRGHKRGQTKSASELPETAGHATKLYKPDKYSKKKTQPVSTDSDKKSQLELNQQRSIRDWFSPQQTKTHESTTDLSLKTQSASSRNKKGAVDRKKTGKLESTSASSSSDTSPSKLASRVSSRERRINPSLDAYLVNSKLHQWLSSPSKADDTDSTPTSSPVKSGRPKTSPHKLKSAVSKARARKCRHTETSDHNSPAKIRRRAPSKSPEKQMDFDSVSMQENCHLSEEEDDKDLCQEDKDLRLAMQLQRQFDLADKLNLNVVRFKGSNDQYSLRESRSNRK